MGVTDKLSWEVSHEGLNPLAKCEGGLLTARPHFITQLENTMKFAVAHANCMDNDITIEIVVADSLKQAIMAHSAFNKPESKSNYDIWFENMPDELEAIKGFCFDGEILVSATEILPPSSAAGL